METAVSVGQRHGKPIIFEILSKEMHVAGYEFFISTNGVWLTDAVPVQFLRIDEIIYP
ncbi:MAG: Phosphate acetyltransferase [Mucilaginibacter sp.]|nr:Phosphate acetyltransferase [Mucilaginibacter sp.]